MRQFMKASGAVVGLVAAVIAFGNWKQSALHTRVCGSDAPYSYNVRWLIEGARTLGPSMAKAIRAASFDLSPRGLGGRVEWSTEAGA